MCLKHFDQTFCTKITYLGVIKIYSLILINNLIYIRQNAKKK